MPSRLSVSSKLTPAAAPMAAGGYATDFAESSIFLTASAVEMSGAGAPWRTATPTAELASGVAGLSKALPEAITAGDGGGTTPPAKGAPPPPRFFVATAGSENWFTLLAPLFS